MHKFIVAVELALPRGIPIREVKAKIETHPVTVAAKIGKYSVLKILQPFLCFLLINSFALFLQ